MKKTAFSSPEQSQVRTELMVQKVRIYPPKGNVLDEVLTAFRNFSPTSKTNSEECKEYHIRRISILVSRKDIFLYSVTQYAWVNSG